MSSRQQGSFLSLVPDSLVLSALKQSEDGEAMVVRVYNPGSSEVAGEVRFAQEVEKASFSRLDETEGAAAPITGGKTIPVRVPPSGIITLRVKV